LTLGDFFIISAARALLQGPRKSLLKKDKFEVIRKKKNFTLQHKTLQEWDVLP
jgi:hypothetical protein